MDQILLTLDITPLALALVALGFVLGQKVKIRGYIVAGVISLLTGINATKSVFGTGYDPLIFPSFLVSVFTFGFMLGNYMETKNRELQTQIVKLILYYEQQNKKNS
jgi:hypothetical protein